MMFFSGLKIKYKLLIAYLASTVIVFVLLAAYVLSEISTQYGENFVQRLQQHANIVAANISAAVVFEDAEEINNILFSLKEDQAIIEAKIRDKDHRLLASIDFYEMPVERWRYRLFGIRYTEASVASNIEFKNKVIGILEVKYHNKAKFVAVFNAIKAASFVVVVALFVGLFISVRFQRNVTQPISRLSAAVRSVTVSKNYSFRASGFYPDEIGTLADDFNSMLDIIEHRQILLESEVKERTLELEQNNAELEVQVLQRKQADEARQRSEQRFEQAFLHAPIGMAILSVDKTLFRTNRVFNELLSFDASKGRLLHEILKSEYHVLVSDAFQELLDGATTNFEYDVKCLRGDGREIDAVISCSATYAADGGIENIVLQLQDVTESRRLSEQLFYQASHDELTNLANRRALKQMIKKTFSSQINMTNTLCMLDLDQFKIVNDTCGHAAGDELLKQFASVLSSKVREDDFVARLGGDEFAIILKNCDKESARRVTENIRHTIELWSFSWEEKTFHIRVSIGAVCFDKPSDDALAVLAQADAACFVAKEQGRNRVYITDADDDHIQARRSEMQWIQEVEMAIEENRLVLFIQEIVPLSAQEEPARYEVLLRLKHKINDEWILPTTFLPAVERYGLTVKIDQWVIGQMLQFFESHPEIRNKNQRYWVNLSGLSISDNHFQEWLEQTLVKEQLRPGLLNFEITETAVMRNLAGVTNAIERLKVLGCGFALDDFGSGTSSLSYLKNLPVDTVKIDGAFVEGMLDNEIDAAFVRSIIDLARAKGAETIAERVESQVLHDELKKLKADYVQGYWHGYPGPIEEIFDA